MEVKNGVVRFEHVNFRYPGAEEDVLHDIDFVAESGKTTAIIGRTGCGKSTLVNLIPRLYDVTGGSITLDGKDIRRITMKDLRDEIGFVPQKGVLFSGTIASNLRFGKDDATDEEIKKAAEIAQATEFIDNRTDGMDTQVSQGGHSLSGGQKQRVAISRAVLKNSEILIFDDATSALDLKTEADLYSELSVKKYDVTRIIIAQRIASVKNADRIVVMDNGRLADVGSHSELIKTSEIYKDIYESQLKGNE